MKFKRMINFSPPGANVRVILEYSDFGRKKNTVRLTIKITQNHFYTYEDKNLNH